MNPAIIVLMALFSNSLALAVIFLVAWRALGRPRHALLWAIAFALGAAHWVVNAIGAAYFPGNAGFFLVSTAAQLTQVFLTLGAYRHRSALPPRWTVMALAGAACLAATAVNLFMLPHDGIRFALLPLFAAGGIALCVDAIRRGSGPATTAEKATMIMFALFALFELALAAAALERGPVGTRENIATYRAMLLLGLPSFYIGAGLFSVFLLAADLAERMRLLAASDPLTGILNRRGFEEAADRAIAIARRHGQPLSLAVADLDHFKSINDRFGHAAGDYVLRRFAALVQGAIRRGDLFARLGGEEFAILLVNTPGRPALEVIDRLREQVAAMVIDLDPSFAITSSFGVTEWIAADARLDPMLIRADRALYRSKIGGRNLVTLDTGSPPIAAVPRDNGRRTL